MMPDAPRPARSRPRFAALCALALANAIPLAAHAGATAGPIVTPRGPGRVGVVWEGTGDAALTLRAPGKPDRVVQAAGANGVFRAEVSGLEPGAEYRFSAGGREGRFMSPPDASQEVRFAVFGDSRTGDDVHRQVVARVAAERPDFYLLTGDAVPNGGDPDEWRSFLDIERPLASTTAFATVRGNHDGSASDFERFVTLRSDTPGDASSYGSADLGPAHFVLLDTETDANPGSAQYRWLEADLARNQAKPLFVVMHRPLFSTGKHGGDANLQRALAPLFQRYGVDVVFQGHDHHYERTRAINGVTYVVTGGAGAPLRGARGAEWTQVSESTYNFLTVEASPTRVHVRAERLDGSQLDAFEIDPQANNAGTGGGPAAGAGTRGSHVAEAAAAPLPNPGGGGCMMLLTRPPSIHRDGPQALALFAPLGVFAGARRALRRWRARRSGR